MKLYYVPNGSLYIEVVNVRYNGLTHYWADVNFYTRPGRKLFYSEKYMKIPYSVLSVWRELE